MKVNAMLLQKRVHFHPGLEVQHLPKRRFREQLRTVALEGQRLKSYSRGVLAFRRHLASKVVRNIESNLHTLRIAQTAEGGPKHPHAKAACGAPGVVDANHFAAERPDYFNWIIREWYSGGRMSGKRVALYHSAERCFVGRLSVMLALVIEIAFSSGICLEARAQEQQKITEIQRGQAEAMLEDARDAVRKNYFDKTFHGQDIDARYKIYKEKLRNTETLGDAFRIIAAFLSGLDDSHTFFIPPRLSYQAEYGYQIHMIGDACFVTELRPETDAAKKLHPGDQVLGLDGFTVNRKDIWQLQYYLEELAPKPATVFAVRDPAGNVRREQILTNYIERKHLKDLTLQHGDTDIFNLVFEQDKRRHLLDDRYVEMGEVMIWKMPAFVRRESDVDHMIDLTRKHKTLILDLRDNSGGYDLVLKRMLGSFFDHDVKLGTQVFRKGEKEEIVKKVGRSPFTGNLIVLVDSASASAAEIFARVVQIEHRGTVVGDHTSGSVMLALDYPFSAGMDIKVFYEMSVTIADVLMSDGKSLEKIGVTPDVVLLPTAKDLAEGQDPVLARAAEMAGIKLDPGAAGKLFPYQWAPLQVQ